MRNQYVNILTNKWFEKKINVAVNQAGPRYSSKLNVSLPINRLFYGLGRNDEFYEEFSNVRQEFTKLWDQSSLKRNFNQLDLPKKDFNLLLKELGKIILFLDSMKKIKFEDIPYQNLAKACNKASKLLYNLDDLLRKAEVNNQSDTSAKQEKPGAPTKNDLLKQLIYEISQLANTVYKTENISNSSFAKISNTRALLLLGEAGIGKTHLLCDIAETRIKKGLPTFLVLGQQLQSINDPFITIIGELKLNLTKKQFLERLDIIAKRKKRRVLFLIDAINEGDRNGWKKGLVSFLKDLEPYTSLGVVLSCRTPFDKFTIPKRAKLIREYHRGFLEHELDALKLYTVYYKIPLPEIPLLTPEFTNPLFLKLFCESLEGIIVKKQHRQIKEISSGQKGMTNIFEDIVIAKSRKIAKQFKCDPRIIWQIIKEDIASEMAKTGKSWLSLSNVTNILSKYKKNKNEQNNLLRSLINESLLSEDVYFDNKVNNYYEVIRFPYQKFSDHILTRHILSTYFNKKGIKNSFKINSYLGNLFADENTISSNAGIIEAIIIEFPNRINNKGELFDYLSTKISGILAELFINGLYWRESKCFNKSTNIWVNRILANDHLRNKLLDALVALATKPQHPYNAFVLDKYLRNFSMLKRDLIWSEFLRSQYEVDTIYKLLNWIENFSSSGISEEYAKMYIILLNWTLTSTNRTLRDRATRALYYLGQRYPKLLFDITLNSLELNDPYISERMIAASYGVSMALHYDLSRPDFNNVILNPYAQKLFRLMFTKNAKFGTTHILTRDYAKHIIDIALLHTWELFTNKEKEFISPPFKIGGLRRWGESEDADKDKYKNGSSPMHMDFENYTLGGLVDKRNNYDFEHEGYKHIKANIFWRIYNLGYSHEAFKNIDSEIAQYNWNRSEHIKVDRYGKKYCWIAFYELSGFLEDNGLLPEKYGERISNIDIDPSFPDESKTEEIIKSDYLGNRSLPLQEWIQNGNEPDLSPYLKLMKLSNQKGPWILLDGFIEQEDLEAKRNSFIFARGVFISISTKNNLLSALKGLSYPGNGRIPEIEGDYYTFAGEIPWCLTFPYNQPKKEINIPTGEKVVIKEKIKRPKKIIVLSFGDNDEIRIPNYTEEDLRKGYIEHEHEKILSYKIELPVRSYNWESGRSIVNPGFHEYIPSKEVCAYLALTSRPQSFDMCDPEGKVASITRRFGDTCHTGHKLTYLRQDLLNKYLKEGRLSLIWIIWGERRIRSKNENDLGESTEKYKSYKVFQHTTVYNY